MEETKRLKAYLELLVESAEKTKQRIYIPVEVAKLVVKDIEELEHIFNELMEGGAKVANLL